MREGIKRTPTKKENQIKWDGAAQQIGIEMYFDGKAFNDITHRVGGETHRDRERKEGASTILEGGGVELKITKLLKFYRYEEPLFDKIHSRSGKLFNKRENKNLLIAIKSKYILNKYSNPYDYLTRVFGRSEEELNNQVNKLLGRNKPSLFLMKEGNKK